ncbi:Protein of uncharacterised function (DUF1407) [Leminorella richardii]|uniref:Protein of uncharacterized function (DUF1407) n=1 Tax=Leminorella richardii TaxID=158841 RepID=A0A2X4UBZ8_9GAMM|nr:zinc ribbon domain-containing protein [Leminorella richardii]SQI36673.1 Protein of uncharacterised function (DUF1407) [Leminorella richardii]
MTSLCPRCHKAMLWQAGDRFCCESCRRVYQQVARCPECGQPLEKLAACGAVDYFCQHGHGLISKKRIVLEYDEQP